MYQTQTFKMSKGLFYFLICHSIFQAPLVFSACSNKAGFCPYPMPKVPATGVNVKYCKDDNNCPANFKCCPIYQASTEKTFLICTVPNAKFIAPTETDNDIETVTQTKEITSTKTQTATSTTTSTFTSTQISTTTSTKTLPASTEIHTLTQIVTAPAVIITHNVTVTATSVSITTATVSVNCTAPPIGTTTIGTATTPTTPKPTTPKPTLPTPTTPKI